MKILVPTDFSTFANYAFDAACQLAQKSNGEIHLFHAAGIPDSWDILSAAEQYRDQLHQSLLSNIRKRMELLAQKAKTKGVKAVSHFSADHFLDSLTKLTKKEHFDFVVMGSQGANAKAQWFLGTNTQKAIRQLHHHVLVIKNPVEQLSFSKVVFTTGLFLDDQKALLHLVNFLRPFEVKELHIVAINSNGFFAPPKVVMTDTLKDFKALVKDIPCHTHYLNDESVEAGIQHFTAMKNVDLIAISNHIRHPLKRLFAGSNVETIVNHADVPVLSIDFSEG